MLGNRTKEIMALIKSLVYCLLLFKSLKITIQIIAIAKSLTIYCRLSRMDLKLANKIPQ